MRGRHVRDSRREDAINRMQMQGSRWLFLKEQFEKTGKQTPFRIKTKGLKPMTWEQALDLKIKRVEEHILNTTSNIGK